MSHTQLRQRVPLVEIEVTPITLQQLNCAVRTAVTERRCLLISAHNLHSTYIYHTNSAFREFYRRSDLIVIDSTPLLTLLRIKNRELLYAHRLGSTDWIVPVTSSVSRVVLLGASAPSNARAVDRLRRAAPTTRIVGVPADPWSEEAKTNAMTTIRNFAPELVLVGMGMPLQERVATELAATRGCRVIATVGGAIDQISGTQALAPRWLGRFGLEWLWRLASNPRRLSHRYLVEPVKLLALLAWKRLRTWAT